MMLFETILYHSTNSTAGPTPCKQEESGKQGPCLYVSYHNLASTANIGPVLKSVQDSGILLFVHVVQIVGVPANATL
jgi:hypothetical protein